MGPCAKTRVTCTIITQSGRQVRGANDCRNPQPVCPRSPGEDYTKCRTVCDQQGHAELQALRKAQDHGINTDGASAIVYGHTYACQACQEALYGAGVAWLRVIAPTITQNSPRTSE